MLRLVGFRFRIALLVAGVCAASALAPAARPAHAQPIRPWTPPSSDSLVAWAAEARARFRSASGDSIGGENFKAYELVGRIARRMIRSLGEANLSQAHAVEPALDSLGLDTEVAIDPEHPSFALVVVHNPFRTEAGSVGWLHWYRRGDLRVQGLSFKGGRDPRMRVWWTAAARSPYEWAIVDRVPGREGFNFTLLRLDGEGYYWRVDQYEGVGPDLGDALEATFPDVNRDGRPELLVWAKADVESLFTACANCPMLLTERLYTGGKAGFELDDSRTVPTAYSTFVVFVRLLRQQNRVAAARLLEDPAKLDRAVSQGWAQGQGRGLWEVEYVEPDRSWPTWLAVRFRAPKGAQRWIVHFTQKEGRWVIRDWVPNERRGPATRPPANASDSTGAGTKPRGGR